MNQETTAHPYLVQLRKQAKELKAQRGLSRLSEAQFELAKSLGFISWPKLVLSVQQKDLQDCIRNGDQPRFEAILEKAPRLATTSFEDGSTPLIMAIEFDDPNMISILHRTGSNMRDRYAGSAHSPLSWALTYGSYHAAVRLVELGEVPDLFCAGGLGNVELLEQFWLNGQLIPNASKTGSSRYDSQGKALPCPPPSPRDQVSDALYLAARCGRLQAAQWLLEHGGDPNWPAYSGATPLHWAEFSYAPGIADLLRRYGGDDSILDPIFLANPRTFGILVLIAWGLPTWRLRSRLAIEPSLANVRGGHGTALHVAVYNDNGEAVRALLEYGADRLCLNAEGKTPLEQAYILNKPAMVELLK
jgi:ankyrin repeat protein